MLKGKAIFRYLRIDSIQTLMYLRQAKLSPGSNCGCRDGVGMGGNTILKVACALGSSSCLRSAFKPKCCGQFLCLLSCTKCAQKFTLTWQIKKSCLLSCGTETITVLQIMTEGSGRRPLPSEQTSVTPCVTTAAGEHRVIAGWDLKMAKYIRNIWRNILEIYTKTKQKSVVLYGDCGFSLFLPTLSWKETLSKFTL